MADTNLPPLAYARARCQGAVCGSLGVAFETHFCYSQDNTDVWQNVNRQISPFLDSKERPEFFFKCQVEVRFVLRRLCEALWYRVTRYPIVNSPREVGKRQIINIPSEPCANRGKDHLKSLISCIDSCPARRFK